MSKLAIMVICFILTMVLIYGGTLAFLFLVDPPTWVGFVLLFIGFILGAVAYLPSRYLADKYGKK